MIRLENWSIQASEINEYLAPEAQLFHLHGQVFNHPRFEPGTWIHSSTVVHVKGNIVTMRSGNKYELGAPNPNYVEWCKAQGRHVPTPEEPIKILNSRPAST